MLVDSDGVGRDIDGDPDSVSSIDRVAVMRTVHDGVFVEENDNVDEGLGGSDRDSVAPDGVIDDVLEKVGVSTVADRSMEKDSEMRSVGVRGVRVRDAEISADRVPVFGGDGVFELLADAENVATIVLVGVGRIDTVRVLLAEVSSLSEAVGRTESDALASWVGDLVADSVGMSDVVALGETVADAESEGVAVGGGVTVSVDDPVTSDDCVFVREVAGDNDVDFDRRESDPDRVSGSEMEPVAVPSLD